MSDPGADYNPRTLTVISSVDEAERLQVALGAKDRWISGQALTWTGLTAHIAAGVDILGGRMVVFGSSVDKTLVASDTNYIFAKNDATFVVNQTGIAPADSILIHTAVTNGSTVTGATDFRDDTLDFDVRIKAFGADFEDEEVTNVGTPTAGDSAATKNYVDTVTATSGIFKLARVISTSAVTLASAVENGDTIDGVALATNDVVLLTAQAAPAENGPWCVDEETEAMTKRGFVRRSDLKTSDEVLTINISTGKSEWQQVEEVCTFAVKDHPMLSMESTHHSSLTTLNHRWPVLTANGIEIWHSSDFLEAKLNAQALAGKTLVGSRNAESGQMTAYYTQAGDISRSFTLGGAPCINLPSEKTVDDRLVELAGWFICEGHIRKLASGKVGRNVRICQSVDVNQSNVDRIAELCESLWGPKTGNLKGKLSSPAWAVRPKGNGCVDFNLNRTASLQLLGLCPNRVPSSDFLNALTMEQLAIFTTACIGGDGHVNRSGTVYFMQKHRGRMDAVQSAFARMGIYAPVRPIPNHHSGPGAEYLTAHRDARHGVAAMVLGAKSETKPVMFTGTVWCPRVPNGTWLARRHGMLYYTGNTVQASGAPVRPTYFDDSTEANALRGALFSAYAGSANSGKVFKHTTTATITLGATSLTFAEVSVQGHAATTTGVHGSTSAATINTLVERNGSGQASFVEGTNTDHAVNVDQLQHVAMLQAAAYGI